MEIHQKKAGPDYRRLKTMVKRSIEQDLRNRNFGPETEIMKETPWLRIRGQKTACTNNSSRLLAMGSQRAVCERRQLQFPPRYR